MKNLINLITKGYLLQLFGAGDVVNTANGTTATGATGYMNANTGIATAYTTEMGLTAEMKTFYDKALIELTSAKLVHEQFGQKRPIPRNGGKRIEFRKFNTLDKALTPITEGVTPTGNKLSVSTIEAEIDQYGDYIEQTDMLEMTAIDNTIVEATKKLADQAGRTMDTIVRNVITAGYNVMYCPTKSGDSYTEVKFRTGLDSTALLRVKDIFRAAAILKGQNAPTIDGAYVAIVHPYVAYDLMQEAGDAWIDIQKYADPDKILRGEIGKLGNVRFVESTEARIIASEELPVTGTMTVASYSDKVITLGTAAGDQLDEDDCKALAGIDVSIDGLPYRIKSATPYAAAVDSGAATAATITLDIDELPDSNNAPTASDTIDPYGTSDGSAVFCTMVLGADAYGITDIAGGGIEHIVKQKGYGNDPLNQRSSIGWKGIKTAVRLVEEYMIRIESCSTLTAEAN